jgi:hypothetical protein
VRHEWEGSIRRREFITTVGGATATAAWPLAAAVVALGLSAAGGAFAQDTVKIRFILPMTGQQLNFACAGGRTQRTLRCSS